TQLSQPAGALYIASDPSELAGLYGQISERLRTQYTLQFALPDDLPAGEHTVAVTASGGTGSASITTTAPPTPTPTPVTASFSGIPETVDEPVRVTLEGAPPGSSIQFIIDGEPLNPGPEPTVVTLDPYALAPGTHEVSATVQPSGEEVATATFEVASLPPVIAAPEPGADLRPGDLVRLTVRSQPGEVTARYLL